MSDYAFFNKYGDCTAVVSTKQHPGSDAFLVPEGTKPDDIWRDPATGNIAARAQYADELPEVVPMATGIEIPAISGGVVLIDGEKVSPGLYKPTEPGPRIVEIKGPFAHRQVVTFSDYALDRRAAYPSWEEQMDMLYHGIKADGDLSRWIAAIDAIKAAHPKPDTSTQGE